MGAIHPQIVHFAVALLSVGVVLRVISLLGRPAFVGPTAATFLLIGTVAAMAAAYSGELAHEPVEAMPLMRPAVMEHEMWGERTRNVFFVVGIIELLALALYKTPKVKVVRLASAAVGLVGLFCLYEAGEHGGQIVYDYGGGIAMRSGNPEHAKRLLLSGLYMESLAERKAGNPGGAAQLIDIAADRFQNEIDVQLLRAESILIDRKDPPGALEALRAIAPPADNRPQRIRHGLLTADALLAAGQRDGAIATLQQLNTDVPNARIQQRLDQLQSAPR